MNGMSICSGIGAPEVAAPWIDWRWQSEIEPFPCSVLSHRFPDAVNLGDMTKFEDWPDADVDVLCGGTPCQAFSVAGLRRGLDDPRGNLMLTYLAIARRYRPLWMVWENVPGVLSSNKGRDFGAFLGGLVELGYGFAYRVLDAQYVRTRRFPRAVPQRRRRVFVVGYLGDWRRAAAVLFDRESLSGNPSPRREPGQAVAALTANGVGTCGADDTQGQSGHLIASEVSHCLNAGGMGRQDYETETFIAHTLRGEGHDASEDGTGRGTPLIPIHFQGRGSNIDVGQNVSGTLAQNCDRASGGAPCVAFSCKDYGADASYGSAPTLRAMGHDGSHANAGGQLAVAFQAKASASNTMNPSTGAPTLDKSKADGMSAMIGHSVRRLTPLECERLMGFPDGWTAVPHRNKPAADGPRYKALGNSWAVNCGEWVFENIRRVNSMEAA